MENEFLNIGEEVTVRQKTRQEAIRNLITEILYAKKTVKKFLNTIDSNDCLKACQTGTGKYSDEAYDLFLCMRFKLKLLKSLFSYMESIARQL